MIKLAEYLKHFKKQVILGPFFKFIEAVFELIVPIVMAKIIDNGVKLGDAPYVLKMGAVLFLLAVVGLLSALICQYYAALASQGVGTMLRNDLFSKINSFSNKEIDEFTTPSLVTRIINDVNQIQIAVALLIRLVVRAPFLVIGATIMAFIIDFKLSLIFILVTPVIALILYLIMKKSVPFYRGIQNKIDRLSKITRENLSGVRVIRAFSRQDKESERFNQANDDLTKESVRVARISALLNPITYMIMNLAVLAILWFGGIRVDNSYMTQGEIIAFVNYATQILLALVVVANMIIVFTKASASASRIKEVLETEPSIREDEDILLSAEHDKLYPKIEFKNVSFCYDYSDQKALKDISFKIDQGQTVGIIGGTGSGKTTLVNLIVRFYDVTSGQILIDGVNVSDYPVYALRKKVGVAMQNSVLFSGTVRYNMQFGNEDAPDDKIYKALTTAQAYDFILKMDRGLDSLILQGGANLSGGQRQRLNIGRALVMEPEILILDDSTSALDFATDAALRKALLKDTADMTVIVVSQRISSIKNADLIIVLDDGAVVGIGTHSEIIDICDIYREICLSQMNNGRQIND